MNLEIHRAADRGNVDLGWLNSNHTFSFGEFYDPKRMGFGKLRVINDDVVAPSGGFATHPHNNMEIISIPLRGTLRHKDSMDNVAIIKAGEVQLMSAGSGVTHSEYNDSDQQDTNFLQIWVQPNVKDQEPGYQQKDFSKTGRDQQWQLVVSPDGRDGSLRIKQEAYFSLLNSDQSSVVRYNSYNPDNGVYLFVIEGEALVNGQQLKQRDGVGILETSQFDIELATASQILAIEVSQA